MLTRQQIERADAWRIKHSAHVKRLNNNGTASYPPSAEDAGHPELWKPAHWRWFMANA